MKYTEQELAELVKQNPSSKINKRQKEIILTLIRKKLTDLVPKYRINKQLQDLLGKSQNTINKYINTVINEITEENKEHTQNALILAQNHMLQQYHAMLDKYKDTGSYSWFKLSLDIWDRYTKLFPNNLQPKEETLDEKPTEININLVKYDK